MRSHYISRQTFTTVELKAQTVISFLHLVLDLFRDGSSVNVFGWNSSKVFVNNALYCDFYAKYRRIKPEQARQIREVSAGHRPYEILTLMGMYVA